MVPSGQKYGLKFAVPAEEKAEFALRFWDGADIYWQIGEYLPLAEARPDPGCPR